MSIPNKCFLNPHSFTVGNNGGNAGAKVGGKLATAGTACCCGCSSVLTVDSGSTGADTIAVALATVAGGFESMSGKEERSSTGLVSASLTLLFTIDDSPIGTVGATCNEFPSAGATGASPFPDRVAVDEIRFRLSLRYATAALRRRDICRERKKKKREQVRD